MLDDITLYEFNSLNEFEKGEALWEYGIYLFQRTEGEIGYSLYQLHDFYAEVKYNGGISAITKIYIPQHLYQA